MKNIVLITLLLINTSVIANSTYAVRTKAPIPDFTAKYSLYKAGIRAAESTVSLERTGATTWKYTSVAKPVGLVSIFRSDRITDDSSWSLVNNQIQINEYVFSHKRGRKQKKYRRLIYNWKTKVASSQVKSNTKNIKLVPGALDKFTLQLRVMRDMATKGKPQKSYPVTDGHRMKYWVFQISGTAKVKTSQGTFDTVILKRERKNKKRTTYLYLAKKLHYLPVKVMHVEKNGSKFYLQLTGLTGLK